MDVNERDDAVITEEMIAVLSAAPGPLTLSQITDASPLLVGRLSIRDPLTRLVQDGLVERDRDPQRGATYRLVRPAPPADTTTATDAPQTHADLVLAALRERGPLSRHQLADAAGCTPKRISDVLTRLARQGQAARIDGALWAAAEPDPGSAAPKPTPRPKTRPQQPSKKATRNQTAPEQGTTDHAATAFRAPYERMPSRATPDHTATAPLIALRSDGVVEIRRTAAAVVEITPDEMAALQQFVDDLRRARA